MTNGSIDDWHSTFLRRNFQCAQDSDLVLKFYYAYCSDEYNNNNFIKVRVYTNPEKNLWSDEESWYIDEAGADAYGWEYPGTNGSLPDDGTFPSLSSGCATWSDFEYFSVVWMPDHDAAANETFQIYFNVRLSNDQSWMMVFDISIECQYTLSPTMDPTTNPTNIPTANPTVQTDDGFVLIERHKDASLGAFNDSVITTGIENAGNPEANTYCIIGGLNPNNYLFDGYYWLKLIYGYSDGTNHTLEWAQTSWITNDTISGANLFGIPEQDEDLHDGLRFYGLGKSHPTADSYLDGNGNVGNDIFWYDSSLLVVGANLCYSLLDILQVECNCFDVVRRKLSCFQRSMGNQQYSVHSKLRYPYLYCKTIICVRLTDSLNRNLV